MIFGASALLVLAVAVLGEGASPVVLVSPNLSTSSAPMDAVSEYKFRPENLSTSYAPMDAVPEYKLRPGNLSTSSAAMDAVSEYNLRPENFSTSSAPMDAVSEYKLQPENLSTSNATMDAVPEYKLRPDTDDYYFVLRHFGGKCVHPYGGAEHPQMDTRLVLHPECDISEKKMLFRARKTSTPDYYVLEHWGGQCVHPYMGKVQADAELVLYPDCNLYENRLWVKRVYDPISSQFMLETYSNSMCVHPKGGASHPEDNTHLVYFPLCNYESRTLFSEIRYCTANSVVGRWVRLRTLSGVQRQKITHGTKKTTEFQRTTGWSVSVTVKVEGGLELVGIGGFKAKTSFQIGLEMSMTFKEEWEVNDEESLEIEFDRSYEGKSLWQWQFLVVDACSDTTPKSQDYAITGGAFQPPRCLPGFQTDGVSYQTCVDREHTLPGGIEIV